MTDQRHDERPLETADLQARGEGGYDDRADDRYDDQSGGEMRAGETRDEAPFADAPYEGTRYEGAQDEGTRYDSAEMPADSTDQHQQVDELRDAQPSPTARDTYAAVEPTEPLAQDSSPRNSLRQDGMRQDGMRQESTSDMADTGATSADETAQLFTGEEVDRFRTEWRGLQSDFVDSPQDAVQHADQLVAQVIQSLTTTFADQKRSLEGQWGEGEQVETEELRVALRQYRAFFDKLLTV